MVDKPDPAAIERRLDAGEWLRLGDIAVLLGVSRTTAHRLFARGQIAYRKTPGGLRYGDPADVRRLLAESRRVQRGADSHDAPPGGRGRGTQQP